MRTSTSITLCLLAALTAGCEPSPVTAPARVPESAIALEAQPYPDSIAWRAYSGIADRRRLVIRDAVAWGKFWQEATHGQRPADQLPPIDFTRDMLIAATMGTRPSGGFAIHVDGIYVDSARVYVAVRDVSPGPGCGVTLAMTAPFTVWRVPRTDAQVVFIEKAEVRSCG